MNELSLPIFGNYPTLMQFFPVLLACYVKLTLQPFRQWIIAVRLESIGSALIASVIDPIDFEWRGKFK